MPLSLTKAISQYKVSLLQTSQINMNSLGGASPIILSFNMQRQIQQQWCWAATAASVSVFYDPTSLWTQCKVATQIMGGNCCLTPMPCNKSSYLDQALTVTNNYVAKNPPLTFQQVEAELSADRVVGARVGWYGGGGHFMVIYGCKTVGGVNYYSIDDPIYGKSEITETAFMNSYQGAGNWTHSYTTKS